MKKLYMFVLCALTALTLSVPAFADLIVEPRPAETTSYLMPALLVLIVAVVLIALVLGKRKK